MSLHSDVEALARALGVWWLGETWEVLARAGKAWVIRRHDSGFEVVHYAGLGQAVDPPTAAIILLGHARGLRVDIGECPACRERGGSIERRWLPATPPPSTHAMALMENEGLRCAWSGAPPDVWPYERPCPACTIDGEPTGRNLLAWERAILDAMPKTSWVHRDGATFGPFESAGDRATRDALGVLADHMQANPDPCAFCRGSRWGYLVDKIGPGVTIEEMNPRREICMICDGSSVDEHGAHKMQIGQCLAAWLCGALTVLDGVLQRLAGEAIANAE